jgi:hypothetical protein
VSQLDRAGHRYEEFETSDTERIRVTYLPHQDWAGGPTLRIQKRAASGRVVQGPEFPASKADSLIRAIRDVIR